MGGERLVVLIAGNHDQPSRLEAVIPLVREHGILIYGSPCAKIESGQYGSFQIESLDEGVFSFKKNGEQAIVACVPYASERTLNEVLYREQEEDQDRAVTYAQKMKELFAKRALWFSKDTINILMAHVFTLGCIKDGSEQSLSLGNSYLLPMETFPEEADYVALGHVHRPQKAVGSQGRIRYSGSPLPYRLQETHSGKGMSPGDAATRAGNRRQKICISIIPSLLKNGYARIIRRLWKCAWKIRTGPAMFISISIRIVFIREEQIKELKKYKEDILEVVPVFSCPGWGRREGKLSGKEFSGAFCRVLYREKRRRTGGGAFGDTYRDHRKGEGI